MTTRRTPRNTIPRQTAGEVSERPTIPASEVGVTLRISEEALRKLDEIQEEAIKAAQEAQKFAWR